ncbi:DUF1552 domain-containing protein [Rhodopirellula sp. SWK7]|uniref:DUF1552 domain-containing protein n=1 Tax=Rhodopirellula sp. SWK7 TaxID=595460 RepID=UPI0005C4F481|nr:DUF1552 domain-containing protein [Rhodopirellula sp. SWK7]
MRQSTLQRRGLLRAAGVSISLPFLASMKGTTSASTVQPSKQRMVCIGNMLGFYPGAFWPSGNQADEKSSLSQDGWEDRTDFQWGRTTECLESLRDQLTVVSGLDHGLKGGHFAIHAFLSGVRQIDAKSMPMANVTIDQYAAEFIAGQTRFPTLTIGSESGIHQGCQLSWTRSGTRVPPIPGPHELFEKLFIGNDAASRDADLDRVRMQSSILDLVRDSANDLNRNLNRRDKDKLDEYMTSVRDVEKRIALRRNWIDVPKPKPPFDQPSDRNMVEDLPLLYDLIALALQTDSTRIATLEIGGDFNPNDLGVSGGYHGLSHHGQRSENIEKLVTLETYQVEQFARFVDKLAQSTDENGSLLEQTTVLFGSGMGNANSHTNSNLPVIIAGGGLRHGRHLAFDVRSKNRPPLTNLFVSMLQNFGLEADQFATSTGTLRGLA